MDGMKRNIAVQTIVYHTTHYRLAAIMSSMRTAIVTQIQYEISVTDGATMLCPICSSDHNAEQMKSISSVEKYVDWIIANSDFETVVSELYSEAKSELWLDFMTESDAEIVSALRDWLIDYLTGMKSSVFVQGCGGIFGEQGHIVRSARIAI
jgi:hypothetical protein